MRQLIGLCLSASIVALWFTAAPCTASLDAGLVMTGGKVYTVVGDGWSSSPQEAIVIGLNGNILYVGTDAEAEKYKGGDALSVPLEGRAVLPGFTDTHCHPLEAMASQFSCQLFKEARADDFADELSRCAGEASKGTSWLLGAGHDINELLKDVAAGRMPVTVLDEKVSDRPAAMLEYQSHSAWLNSAALKEMGWESGGTPAGGVVQMSGGSPTGIVFENAVNMVFHKASGAIPADQTKEDLVEGLKPLSRAGITGIIDGRTYFSRQGNAEAWTSLKSEDRLPVRVVLTPWIHPEKEDDAQIAELKGYYSTGTGAEDLVRTLQVKIYSDGIIDQGTAALLSTYSAPAFSPDIIIVPAGTETSCEDGIDNDNNTLVPLKPEP
mmetsp:Transcript_16525/g.39785  ORF Transcript_16525/g.39785 Transcript_16525/m.39785 type:complete len:381 (-) Transcript_16525:80-1222(-)